ncbi:hypothetical protein BH24ACI2_BH24ACI2_11170 [soil metagenome]|nr:hypothetical protein [Acidobacteriota bacterium]
MSFGWRDLQELAEKLKQEPDEASKRAAISRIYYAAFWRARDFLMEDGFVFHDFDGSHRQVWREFERRGKTFRAVGISGMRLHKIRVQADCFIETEDINRLKSEAFNLAENIFSYLQQIEKKIEK